MRDWIVIAVVYVLALGLFRLLGAWGAAAEALRRWGESSSWVRARPRSSS